MAFTDEQISIATQLKQLGMPWQPRVGNYVYDANRICPKGSPFQDRIYFLLNFDCFMQHVGGRERFAESMVWLPTWDDARNIARQIGIPDESVAAVAAEGILRDEELTRLYGLILATLRKSGNESVEPPCD